MPVPPPFLVSYSITTKCNLKCRHCYSESTDQALADELTTQEALSVIDDLAQWKIGLLIIDGGEPLCRDDLLQITAHAAEKGIRTVLGTNGTLIDRSTAREMRKAGIQAVAISLDGANAEVHDNFRGEAGSFDKALAAADACKAEELTSQFNMVIRRQTQHQLHEMLRLNAGSGSSAAEFFDLVLAGRAKEECQGDVLGNEERRQAMESLAEAQTDYPVPIRVAACPMYPLLVQEKGIEPKHFPAALLARIPYWGRGCAAGVPMGYLVIRANGELNPCMLLQTNLGNLRQNKITTIWEQSPVLAQLRSRELKGSCGICQYKSVCAGCRGRAYEETGDLLATDPGCWLAPSFDRQH